MWMSKVSLNICMKHAFKNLEKDHLCKYCSHFHYISIGGQSAVQGGNHMKTETGVDVVVIVVLHLKRQNTFLHMVRHSIIQKGAVRWEDSAFLISSNLRF